MDTIDVVSQAFGPPRLFREYWTGPRLDASIGRWRHDGACVDLSGGDAFQFIFNVSGGQRVELRQGRRATSGVMRAGSLGVVVPDHAPTVRVAGPADTVQIFLTRRFVEAVNGGPAVAQPLPLHPADPELQAVGVQALVALSQSESAAPSGAENTGRLERALRTVARRFARPAPRERLRGGLAPLSVKRVDACIDRRLREEPCDLPSVGELADLCGLSLHHFITAFRQSRGRTPHAHMTDRRLEASLRSLLHDGRVDETADAMGFSSPSHFVSAFRARMGVTPGALSRAASLQA